MQQFTEAAPRVWPSLRNSGVKLRMVSEGCLVLFLLLFVCLFDLKKLLTFRKCWVLSHYSECSNKERKISIEMLCSACDWRLRSISYWGGKGRIALPECPLKTDVAGSWLIWLGGRREREGLKDTWVHITACRSITWLWTESLHSQLTHTVSGLTLHLRDYITMSIKCVRVNFSVFPTLREILNTRIKP